MRNFLSSRAKNSDYFPVNEKRICLFDHPSRDAVPMSKLQNSLRKQATGESTQAKEYV